MMEGYDLFSDDLPSLGGSMLDGLAELGGGNTSQAQQNQGHHQGADQQHHLSYPPSSHQGQLHQHQHHQHQHQAVRVPAPGPATGSHSYPHGNYPHPSGVLTDTRFSLCRLFVTTCKLNVFF